MNFLLAQREKSGVKVSPEGVESSVLTLGTVVDDGESDERGLMGSTMLAAVSKEPQKQGTVRWVRSEFQ